MPSSKFATKPSPDHELPEPVWQWAFEAIGTHWWIGLYDAVPADPAALQHKIAKLIDGYDQVFSRFRTGSLVDKMSQKAGTYELPKYAAPLLAIYYQLYTLTNGQVTPLVGQLLADAGYDAGYSLQAKEWLAKVPRWEEVLDWDGGQRLTVKKPALLDVGAAGKGQLIDLVSELLANEGCRAYCVDAGGDMYTSGVAAPLRIGLENPNNFDEVIGVVDVQNGALCGSAPNRRTWGGYHHIMDPRAGRSTDSLQAAWVLAESAMVADGLTTALFFAEPELLKKQFNFLYACLTADGGLHYSPALPAEFFA